MQILEYGQYCGSVGQHLCTEEALVSSVNYSRQTFNSLLHYHENAHISLVLKGGCRERKKTTYELLPGSVCYYHAGEPHQMLAVDDYSLDIHIDIHPEFFQRFALDDGQIELIIKVSPEAKLLMVRAWRELLAHDNAAMLSVQMELIRLFSGPPKSCKPNGLPSEMRLVADFLLEHWDGQVTLAELSRISGLHPVTICKYFSRYFGCTLGEHMRNLKVAQALRLLPSDMPLTELACRCGFFDQSHFTRTFKQLTGFLPLQFRNARTG